MTDQKRLDEIRGYSKRAHGAPCFADCSVCFLLSLIDSRDAEVAGLRDAALAFQDLNVCYRLGKRPSEKLFKRLESARITLEKWKGNSD